MKLHSMHLIDLLTFYKSHYIAEFLKHWNSVRFFLVIARELNLMHYKMAYDERSLCVYGTNKRRGLH